TYMFSFGPLSGLADIANGQPGTEFPSVFNTVYAGTPLQPGDPATTDNSSPATPFTYNGAVGLTGDQAVLVAGSGSGAAAVATLSADTVTAVTVTNGGSGYLGAPTVSFSAPPLPGLPAVATAP